MYMSTNPEQDVKQRFKIEDFSLNNYTFYKNSLAGIEIPGRYLDTRQVSAYPSGVGYPAGSSWRSAAQVGLPAFRYSA